jgi:hypothetical protein
MIITNAGRRIIFGSKHELQIFVIECVNISRNLQKHLLVQLQIHRCLKMTNEGQFLR